MPPVSCLGLVMVNHGRIGTYSRCQSHASRDKVVCCRLVRRHHAKLAFVDKFDQVIDLGLDVDLREVGLLVGVGRLVTRGCVGERHCV